MTYTFLKLAAASIGMMASSASAITLDINKPVEFDGTPEYQYEYYGYSSGVMRENGFTMTGWFTARSEPKFVSAPDLYNTITLTRDDGRAFFLNSVSFLTPTFSCARLGDGSRSCLQFASVSSSEGTTKVSTYDPSAAAAVKRDNDGLLVTAEVGFGAEVNGSSGVTSVTFETSHIRDEPGVTFLTNNSFDYNGTEYYYEYEYDYFSIMQMDVSLAPVITPVPVPVPGAGGLALVALGGLALARRRTGV